MKKGHKYFDEASTRDKPLWSWVDIEFVERFSDIVSLEALKQAKGLEKMMVTQKGSRLSVQPVTKSEYDIVVRLGRQEGLTVATTLLSPSTATDQRAYRLTSIDMVRGLVIVIMAIDHVRDNFFAGAQQDPMADPNIAVSLFATRWITHFCAPVFVLLAGVSAGLMVARRSRA